jgi:iduronate 2-sulfatase
MKSKTKRATLSRRDLLVGLAGASAYSLMPATARALEPPAKPLNVLLLMCDQYRPDALSLYGDPYALTPNLDRLAKQGVNFRQTYCQVPICVASRNSILTGRYAHSTGVVTNGCLASPDQISFPQYLRGKGYFTACFGKLHTPGREKQDWDVYNDDLIPAQGKTAEENSLLLPMLFGADGKHSLGAPSPLPETETQEWRAIEATIGFLEKKHDKPWLVQCSLLKPHPPLQPPKKYWDMIDRSKLQIPERKYPKDDLADANPRYLKRMKGRGLVDLPEETIKDAMQGYYGNIAFDDFLLGKVLQALDASGERNNTLVIFTADHGEMLDDHRLWAKMVFFDPSVRIPMIAHLPGRIGGGTQTKALVEHIDIFPTICEALGFSTPTSAQGKSFLALAEGKTKTHKKAVYSEFPNIPIFNADGSYNPTRMRFDGRYKVVDNGPTIGPELYDQQSDPSEIHNLVHDPAQKSRLESTLANIRSWATQDAVPVHPISQSVADPG